MKQLFITDLDGTLLTPDGIVSPKSAEIISQLSSKGIAITVATARTPATVEPLLANTVTTIPAIVLTGAALWDRQNKQYLVTKFFSESLALSAWSCLKQFQLRPFVYILGDDDTTLHTHFCGVPTIIEQKFINERTGNPLKQIHVSATPTPPNKRTMLLFAIGEKQPILKAAEELRAKGCSVSAYPDNYTPNTYFIEVFATGVSKASAVKQLKQLLKADKICVFGDNLNDLPMMQVSDTAVAVGNALDQVKQQADIIIGDNTTDSVAIYIQQHC